ncbi:class II aldolase/adducin family protein, partial [Citreimonas sp.]|uniref:class II aldolase/adducin family protein n=1 Tax=Citreimonas sp. TaxID=3036715 RepID=UPI0035C792EA
MADGALTESIDTVRRDLAAAYRLIALHGMDDGIYTHISARLPDGANGEKRFLLNPYGLSFDEVTAANLVTVDETGAVVDDPYGAGVNAAGFTIHSAVHMA